MRKVTILSYNVDEDFDKNVLKSLPTEIEVPNGEDIEDYILDKVGVPVYEYKVSEI